MIKAEVKYKKTEIDWMPEVPEDWGMQRAKTIFVERSIKNKPNEPLLAASQTQGVVLKSMLEQRSMEAIQNFETFKLVEINDFVISLRSFEGGVELAYFKGIISPVYNIFRARNIEYVDVNYFKFIFKSSLFIQELNVYKTGIRDGQSISYKNFGNIFLPIPPLEEQKVIADYLDTQTAKITHFIQTKKRFIELLKEQRQSIIEIAIKSEENWTKSKIKNIAKMFGRIGFRGYQTSDLVNKGKGAITISPSNMKDNKMNFNQCSYLSWAKYEESPEIKIFQGDILFVKTGATYGKVALVQELPEKATINPQLMVFKELKIDAEYFCYYLQTGYIKEQVDKTVIGGTIPTISQTKVGTFQVYYPNPTEQKQIVQHIKAETRILDIAISKAEREIELIKEYREAMIAEAVTGKIKL